MLDWFVEFQDCLWLATEIWLQSECVESCNGDSNAGEQKEISHIIHWRATSESYSFRSWNVHIFWAESEISYYHRHTNDRCLKPRKIKQSILNYLTAETSDQKERALTHITVNHWGPLVIFQFIQDLGDYSDKCVGTNCIPLVQKYWKVVVWCHSQQIPMIFFYLPQSLIHSEQYIKYMNMNSKRDKIFMKKTQNSILYNHTVNLHDERQSPPYSITLEEVGETTKVVH